MKHKILMAVLAAAAASNLRTQASQIDVDLSDWSIITSGNLEDVSDYQGNAYVGGNVTVGNSFDGGTQDSDNGGVSLAVAGNISGGNPVNIDSGSVIVGGSTSGRTINVNGGGTVTTGNSAAVPSSPVAQVTSASQYWSGLSANSSVSIVPNSITFNCAANKSVAVFNITAAQLFAQNQNPIFNLSSSTVQILVNVSGTTAAELNSENFANLSSLSKNLIWNFYQATSVSLSGIDGYVIAPDATVTASSPIVGGVMAEALDTTSEVELGGSGATDYLTAPDLATVPDGGTTAALLGAAFTGVAVIRRKYARQ